MLFRHFAISCFKHAPSVIDVLLGIEMADAGTHRIKIANLCRFCGKTASSKKTFARPKEKLSLNSNDKVSMLKTTTTLFIPLISVCLTCDVRKDNRAQISILTSVCHAEVGTSSTVLQRDEKLAPR